MIIKKIVIYNNTLSINSWVKLNREYFTDWKTKVWENGELIYENKINLTNKRVYIPWSNLWGILWLGFHMLMNLEKNIIVN